LARELVVGETRSAAEVAWRRIRPVVDGGFPATVATWFARLSFVRQTCFAAFAHTTSAACLTKRVAALVGGAWRWGWATDDAHITALLPDLRCLLAVVAEPDDIVPRDVGDLDFVDDAPRRIEGSQTRHWWGELRAVALRFIARTTTEIATSWDRDPRPLRASWEGAAVRAHGWNGYATPNRRI